MGDVGISEPQKIWRPLLFWQVVSYRTTQETSNQLRKNLNTRLFHLWDEISHFLIPIKDDGGATISDSSRELRIPTHGIQTHLQKTIHTGRDTWIFFSGKDGRVPSMT